MSIAARLYEALYDPIGIEKSDPQNAHLPDQVIGLAVEDVPAVLAALAFAEAARLGAGFVTTENLLTEYVMAVE